MQNNNKKIIFAILIVLISILIIYPKSIYHYDVVTNKKSKSGECFGITYKLALKEGWQNLNIPSDVHDRPIIAYEMRCIGYPVYISIPE